MRNIPVFMQRCAKTPRFAVAVSILALFSTEAWAQDTATVIPACGTPPRTLVAGTVVPIYMDQTTGAICTNAAFSGTISVGTVSQGAKGSDAAADSWYVQPGTGAIFPVSQSGSWTVAATQSTSPWVVGQSTAANLNATVVGTGTFAVQAGQTGTWTVQPGNTANTTPWLVSSVAATTGGASNYHVIASANDNHAVVKNGAATVYDVDCTSSSDGTATDYVRLYDAGTGFNGCNSATNIVWGMVCPAPVTAAGIGGGFAKSFPVGRAFASGVSICITGNGTPSDTATTNAHTTTVVNVGYK